MSFDPDLDLDRTAEPVFVEALAAAAHTTPGIAAMNFEEVQDLTDLHRVETFIELTTTLPAKT